MLIGIGLGGLWQTKLRDCTFCGSTAFGLGGLWQTKLRDCTFCGSTAFGLGGLWQTKSMQGKGLNSV